MSKDGARNFCSLPFASSDIYDFFCVLQVKLREMKPGMLSQELKEALGMPEGAPPPWLINMPVIKLHHDGCFCFLVF